MARTNNLTNFLTDVADAIKTKKGTTDKISAANFDTEIASIETGSKINNQDKTVIENGTYTADSGYTGLGTVEVNIPQTLSDTDYDTALKLSNDILGLKTYKVMTAVIDQTNSNPDTCIEYQDDATTMTAKSDDWDTFFNVRPCLFKDGAVVGYLNPNNFAQFEDGTSADITSGDAGDVMIEIPRMGLKLTNNNDEKITVSITDNPNNSDFKYYAHSRGTTIKDNLYVGAYLGFNQDNKIRSLSGKTPSANITYANFLTYCQANGKQATSGSSGYDMLSWYAIELLQAMYILKYKSLNSQTALGMGYVNANAPTTTGGTNEKGMCYGETTGKEQMKLFGVEDFWGNLLQFVAGLYVTDNKELTTATENFNSAGEGFTIQGTITTDLYDYSTKMTTQTNTTEGGFIPVAVDGSDSTYYCDYDHVYSTAFATFGGYWLYGADAGAFYVCVGWAAVDRALNLGARLMYL